MDEHWTPSETPSVNVQCILKYLDALQRWNVEDIVDNFHESFRHQVLPMSLRRPEKNLEEYREYFTSVIPLLKDFKVTVHDLLETPEKIAFHASSTAEATSDGTPYTNEYIIIMYFAQTSDGAAKIVYYKEFVDSAFSIKFFEGERQKLETKAKAAQR